MWNLIEREKKLRHRKYLDRSKLLRRLVYRKWAAILLQFISTVTLQKTDASHVTKTSVSSLQFDAVLTIKSFSCYKFSEISLFLNWVWYRRRKIIYIICVVISLTFVIKLFLNYGATSIAIHFTSGFQPSECSRIFAVRDHSEDKMLLFYSVSCSFEWD